MTIPQEAIEAAARVMKPRQFEPNYTPLSMWSDLEQMHEIAELDRDLTRDRVRDILTAALPAIEKQIREQVAADIWEYWDACGDLIDDRDHFPASKIKTAQAYVLRHPTQGGQVNSTDYEEDIDAAMKARIEEDGWS